MAAPTESESESAIAYVILPFIIIPVVVAGVVVGCIDIHRQMNVECRRQIKQEQSGQSATPLSSQPAAELTLPAAIAGIGSPRHGAQRRRSHSTNPAQFGSNLTKTFWYRAELD